MRIRGDRKPGGKTWRLPLGRRSAALTASLLAAAVVAAPASDPAGVSGARRYDGLTLDEWRERVKNLDPAVPESAKAVPGLIAIVRDRDAGFLSRQLAAAALGRLGPASPEGVPVLVEILGEPASVEGSPRVWAAKGLSLYGPAARAAAGALLSILQDDSLPLLDRSVALEALAQIGPSHPVVLPALVALLDPPKPLPASAPADDRRRLTDAESLRELAVESFLVLGANGDAGVPALTRVAQEPKETLRLKAVIALGGMGGRGAIAVPTLAERMLFDDSAIVRDAASDALGRIGVESVPILVQLLDDSEPASRARAASALARIGAPARPAAAALRARLADDSPSVRLNSAEAYWKATGDARPILPTLVAGMADEDRQVRIRAYRLLIALRARARPAVPHLRALAEDERAAVRSAAAKAIERIGTE